MVMDLDHRPQKALVKLALVWHVLLLGVETVVLVLTANGSRLERVSFIEDRQFIRNLANLHG